MDRTTRIAAATTCVVVAILAGTAAAIGVLARGGETAIVTSVRGETYEMVTTGVYAYNAERVVAEGVGWDVVTLLLVAPALLVAAWFVARGSYRGRLAAAGLLGYALYQYLEYAVTWAFGPLFLVFVAIAAASLVGIGLCAASLARDEVPAALRERFPRRGWAALMLGMSGLLTLLWIARIGAALGADPPALLGETTMKVQALDLALVVPVSVASAVLVLRRSDVGFVLAAAYGVTFVTLAIAITAMLVSAALVDGVAEVVPIAIFGLAAVAGAGLLVRMYGAAGHGPAVDPPATRPEAVPVG
jgi:hypothetical protein